MTKWRTRLALGIMASLPLVALAADYPSETIKIIVPYAAGGGTDTAARLLAKHLEPVLDTSIIIENKAGGATQIGTNYVVRAKPDGYTLLMGTANLATNAVLYDELPYDVAADLRPISQVTDVPVYLFAAADAPIKSLEDFSAFIKQEERVSYATAGVGSIPHLAGEMLSRQADLKLEHIPYKGSSEAVIGVVSNQVPVSLDNLPPAFSQVRAEKMFPIAIAAKERSISLPEVPTFTELGIELEAASWWGMMAPAATPDEVVKTLADAIQQVMADSSIREFFVEQGMNPVGGTPDEFGRHIKDETAKWQRIVDAANIRIGDN